MIGVAPGIQTFPVHRVVHELVDCAPKAIVGQLQIGDQLGQPLLHGLHPNQFGQRDLAATVQCVADMVDQPSLVDEYLRIQRGIVHVGAVGFQHHVHDLGLQGGRV